jgi:hypothetical protein
MHFWDIWRIAPVLVEHPCITVRKYVIFFARFCLTWWPPDRCDTACYWTSLKWTYS